MGKDGKDQHFDEYWKTSKKNELIRGAYHFYRPKEDPVQQANNFLETVKLESGDLRPVLDIEKIPKHKSLDDFRSDLKVWLKLLKKLMVKSLLYIPIIIFTGIIFRTILKTIHSG